MRSHKRYWIVFLLSLLVLGAVFFFSLTTGRYPVTPHTLWNIVSTRFFGTQPEYTNAELNLFTNIRLPRLLAAGIIGAGLSLAGASYQSVFRNPLVSPYLLGVSQGAAVGAALAILCGMSALITQSWALVGGLCAVLLATGIPRILRNQSTLMLVLSGVIVGGFGTALLGALKYLADLETQLAAIEYWQMGSLASTRQDSLAQLAFIALPCLLGLLLMRWRINILSLGDRQAQALGVNLPLTRGIVILLATFITAACVCLAGTVSWVGLVIPHLCRLLVGADNKKLMPLSLVVGAAFMMLVDTLCRSLTGSEIPLSILTGFIGTPLYLFLLVFGRIKVR